MALNIRMALVLVTGSGGFLGSEINRQAVAAGLNIRATGRSNNLASTYTHFLPSDITTPGSLDPCMDGVETVIHAAGLAHIFDAAQDQADRFQLINETGTANVAQVAARSGVKHFVLVSSVSVYGGSRDGGHEESGYFPDSPYALSKYKAELRAIEIAESSGMALTILRLATLFGAGDPGNVGRLMRSIDRRRFIWVGNGSNRKSLLHVRDAARACINVAQSPAEGVNIYNVSAPPCTMRTIVDELSLALKKRPLPIHVPAAFALTSASVLGKLTGHRGRLGTLHTTLQKWLADDIYDAQKFEQAFDFRTQINLSEGLREEVAWYRNTMQ
jgi:nucleoside-diphosphate-sugar epimerase